ncbi:phospholipase D family protein [Brevibacillus parabrevis]|uniref:phospholipase D family protein n=1 Tax=Brevibacillus parabrevis TaxID=54914 RepID=UPI001F604EAC|nr:phospholipase D family protein [Brevibacillus parabrevis]MDR4998969.1 phospholipase D family protein [Brevibacillus parabrevis]
MEIKILATGLGWLGNGVESITANLEELILNAQYEIMICAYKISTGASDVLELINAPLSRGVDVRILVNQFHNHHSAAQAMLASFSRKFINYKLYDFTHPDGFDLHAKMIVVDRERAIIGSSNISRRGFFENHELAVMLSGQDVNKVANAFEKLVTHQFTKKIDL